MHKTHRSVFLKSVKEKWPHLKDRINSEGGLLHIEVKHVRDHIQHLIDSCSESELRDAVQFIEQAYLNGDSKVKNAIDVSIIEELEFKDRGKLNRSWPGRSFRQSYNSCTQHFMAPLTCDDSWSDRLYNRARDRVGSARVSKSTVEPGTPGLVCR